MNPKQLVITTFLFFLVHVLVGQNTIQDIAKQACSCIEKDTTILMQSRVQNCVSSIYAKNAQMNAKVLSDITKLRQTLSDIKFKVYTECEYVVLEQKEARELIYQGSKSDKASSAFKKGNVFLVKQEYEKALPFFKTAIEQDTAFIEALDHLALCYRHIGDLKNAEDYYKKSLKIEPRGQTAVQNLAVIYSIQKIPEQAIVQYQALLEADLSNPEGYFGIARVILEINSDKKASLEKALELTDIALNIYRITKDPNLKDGLLLKGLIYYFLNDEKNAKKYLEEAKSKGVEIPAEIAKKLKIR